MIRFVVRNLKLFYVRACHRRLFHKPLSIYFSRAMHMSRYALYDTKSYVAIKSALFSLSKNQYFLIVILFVNHNL